MNRTLIGRDALRGALDVRRQCQKDKYTPICIYDLATDLGVKVRFVEGSSFEGMFEKNTSTIFIPSQRGCGRRAFACAHELGHWYFSHGTHVNELAENSDCFAKNEEEVLVDQFAGHLLMPRPAITKALKERGIKPESLTPNECYMLSCQFGVGYETLITHLNVSAQAISDNTASCLKKTKPLALKSGIVGEHFPHYLAYVDQHWLGLPIDLEVGDAVFTNFLSVSDGANLSQQKEGNGCLYIATEPGISKLSSKDSDWAVFVRVSRKGYTGLAKFRHMEEAND